MTKLLIFITLEGISQQNINFGIKLGSNASGIYNNNHYTTVTRGDKRKDDVRPVWGYIGGGFIDYQISKKWTLSSELFYQKTGRINIYENDGMAPGSGIYYHYITTDRYDFTYLQLPIIVCFNIRNNKIQPFIGIGAVPSYMLSGKHYHSSKNHYDPEYSIEYNENLFDESKFEPIKKFDTQITILGGVSIREVFKVNLSYTIGPKFYYMERLPEGAGCATGFIHYYQNKSLTLSIYYRLKGIIKHKKTTTVKHH